MEKDSSASSQTLWATTAESIQDYLCSFPNRDKLKYAVMDMNRGFFEAVRTFLPNARIIIDRLHVVRFCTDVMENVRRDVQYRCFMAAPDRTEADRRLDFWLDACDRLQLPEFMDCRKMLRNWRNYFLNAFDIHLSNGFTEGCSNAIKTLKRASFGCRSFSRFRKRVLLSFSLHPNI